MTKARAWLDNRRRLFGDGLDTVYASLEKELEAEFARRDEEKGALSNAISDLIIRGSRANSLQKQNESLKTQLAEALEENRLARQRNNPPENTSEWPADGRTSNPMVPCADYEALAKKYNDLARDVKEYKRSYDFVLRKCHFYKDRVKQWEEYKAYQTRKAQRALANCTVSPNTTEERPSPPAMAEAPSGAHCPTKLTDSKLNLETSGGAPPPSALTISSPIAPSIQVSELQNLDGLLNFDQEVNLVTNAQQDCGSAERQLQRVSDTPEQDSPGAKSPETIQARSGPAQLTGTSNAQGQVNSSQTTEDDFSAHPQSEQDNNVPVFLSSRSVRRRGNRAGSGAQSLQERSRLSLSRHASSVNVKEESVTGSSPVKPLSQRKRLARTNTMDLDEDGAHLDTPRKRRRLYEMIRNTGSKAVSGSEFDGDRNERCTSLPLGVKTEGLQDIEMLDLTDEPLPLGLVRSNSDPVFKIEADEEANLSRSGLHESKYSRSLNTTKDNSRVLHPMSPNVRTLPRTSSPADRSKRRNDDSRGANAVHMLAEDGDSRTRQGGVSSKSKSKSPACKFESTKRLQMLLETESPQRQALRGLSAPPTKGSLRPGGQSKSTSPVQRTPFTTGPSQGRPPGQPEPQNINAAVARTPLSISFSRVEDRQSEQRRKLNTPLRSRPLESLCLEDFKVNPNYIGNNLPTDSVRDRDTRRCLPGCNRPCCTSIFRAMAEAGARPALPAGIFETTSSPPELGSNSSPGSGDAHPALDAVSLLSEEDRRLLHHHLGDSYSRERINRMPDCERNELLLEARARLLSDRHGRHRRVWERAKSPPGFWRADMPSTQELENDRDRAVRMERDKVTERWEDARRGCGRWMFRDE